ncbi:DNA polymerase III subunit gamma and tau [Sinomonas sp. JGH33]|uniref:DNA-directed DNA polymerase n=1 Tax=Sinomonas terricola TaxID=3110330 RepID=A0ABU5T5N8_9MICC|nr:DNA polymerase III subunit gamma and tau [Sinomonas sp. JGH33]MEA5454974.1 DNA polymerase III subunit gamma and tau [Sinomonas sp. JGH33]
MSSPTALYRRYRPDTFQDVIGQEHVTEPLMTALRKDRVNHAYLFSGPRGCGKTTSARILARCLNCEKGPTPEPCGVCPSCVELARGGSGSLDVIEIDAASHGGVDDARDLRERATFAPVRDRYKIFIIDEAHMVTSAGFNALLKIVEEPPEHIKFIFATTEPDKVIGTIRSRTHHYPFRLVPPEPLMAYLEQLCAAEHVPVQPGVLSLVVRAGGGSVRDSLSVLDQLMAGAGTGGIDYELAVALLGYTHAALLDDVVDAVAAADSGTVFRAVDRVIQTGHDPRRFVEDLLERFRDLIIVRALPDAAESILRGVPADQLARMRAQAQSIGAAELSRAADVTSAAFNEMTGATSPRLHLELLCARLMLPAADGDHGLAARLDRLERRLSFEGGAPGPVAVVPEPAAAPTVATAAPAPSAARASVALSPGAPSVLEPAARVEAQPTAALADQPAAAQPATAQPAVAESAAQPAAAQPAAVPAKSTSATPATAPAADVPPPGASTSGGSGSVEMFRRAWPEILENLTAIKRLTWILVSQNATVAGFDGRTLTLAFANSGSAGSFTRGDHSDNVRQAIHKVLGVEVQIDATTGGNGPSPSAAPATPRGAERSPKAPADPPPSPRAPETAAADRSAAEGVASADYATEQTGAPAQPGISAVANVPSAPRDHGIGSATPEPAAQPSAPSAADVAWGLAPAPAPAPEQGSPEQARPAKAQPQTAPAETPAAPVRPTAASSAQATAAAPVRHSQSGFAEQMPTPSSGPAVQPSPPSSAQTEQPQSAADSSSAPAASEPTTSGPTPAPEARESRPAPATTTSVPRSDDPYADIPYADDEPPAEWDEPLPEDEGWRRPSAGGRPSIPSAASAETRATPAPVAAPVPLGQTPRSGGRATAGDTSSASARGGEARGTGSAESGQDPWSYARESAPGVWTVGAESNVGSAPSAPAQPAEAGPAEAQTPREAASPSYAPAAAQPPAQPSRPAPGPAAQERPSPQPPANGGRPLSMYQRLSQKAAQDRENDVVVQAPRGPAPSQPVVEDIPSADDETIEASGVFGRAAVERILGGKLIEERAHDGTVIPPR